MLVLCLVFKGVLYGEWRLCINLRDMDMTGMQWSSGCCGEYLTSFDTVLFLFESIRS